MDCAHGARFLMLPQGGVSVIGRHLSRLGRRGPGIAVAALLALAIAPATALASRPRITDGPYVTGTPQVGETLTGVAQWEGTPDPTASWQWFRCGGPGVVGDECDAIRGATAITYTLTPADESTRIRVRLTLRNVDGSDRGTSETTAPVLAAPPPPEVTPTPTPTPEVTPTPTPTPEVTPPPTPTPEATPTPTPPPEATPTPTPTPEVTRTPPADGSVLPSSSPAAPATAAAPVGAVRDEVAVRDGTAVRRPAMMRPAPLVRIRGRLTPAGARISLFTVTAPKGARIAIRCIGSSCPARRWARATLVTRVARFQAELRAGTRVIVMVTMPGTIGKHTTILIRRDKPPVRWDRCVMPGSRKAVRCPAV